MPTPKSVTKTIKGEDGKVAVEFTSEVDRASFFLFELNRAALRDVGKYVRKLFNEAFYSHFGKITGSAGKVTKSSVLSSKNTQYPRVDIGLPKTKKGKKLDGWYAYFQEFGTNKPNSYGVIVPRLGLLQHAVEDHVDEIIKIESQYLSALEKEPEEIETLIDEEEHEDEDE